MSLTQALRVGLRREVLIFFPAAVLLLIVLCGFLLVSYRTAVELSILQRQEEAAQFAARVANTLPKERLPNRSELGRATTGARRAAIVGPKGRVLVEVGYFSRPPLFLIAEREQLSLPIGIGPNDELPSAVGGFAPVRWDGHSYTVRVDIPADELALQSRALNILTWVVAAISLGVVVLVVLYSRHLLRPYETLLAQARRMGENPVEGDEIEFLTRTVERAIASFVDSDQQPAEEEIAALQRALGPSLESGFMLLSRDAEVMSVNRYGALVLGVNAAEDHERIGQQIKANPELSDLLGQAVAAGTQVQRREVQIEVDEEPRTLGVTVHPLLRDDGEVRAFLALFADLTEAHRQEREEQLTENLAHLGEMAAGVAHELRNSLATLRGYLALIERRPEEESLTDYLGEMRHESDHLQRVVDDFLAFARPETTRLEDVDLVELARRAVADPALGPKSARLVEPRTEVPPVRGDAQLLERALKNLIHNAVRAQQDEGIEEPVLVEVGAQGRRLELKIEDLGGGLPAEVRERLFQPFVTSRPDGVGLGLTLARRIVSLHGGSLTLADRPGGTCATIGFVTGSDNIV